MTDDGLTRPETAGIQRAITGSRDATARLLTSLEGIDDLDVTRPSLLPDWTVGHVLTHLARNADSFVWILRSASEDKQVPQYPGGAAGRSRDIAEGALRPAEVIVEDLRGLGGAPGCDMATRCPQRCGCARASHRRFPTPMSRCCRCRDGARSKCTMSTSASDTASRTGLRTSSVPICPMPWTGSPE